MFMFVKITQHYRTLVIFFIKSKYLFHNVNLLSTIPDFIFKPIPLNLCIPIKETIHL